MSSRDGLMHRLREAALWLGAVLGVVCLLLAALAWLFDIRPLVFRSGSMSPAIEAGAVAFAREVPADQVSEGDVVSVVNAQGVRVTHRVVSVDTSGERVALQLKGDANSTPDQETYRVDEVYRVFGDVPWAGYVVNAASSPWGLLVCGGFVAVLLVSAFGKRGSGDGEGGQRRMVNSVASVATAGVVAVSVAPIGTMASWTDTSRVSTGSITAATVASPTSPRCVTSGVLLTTAEVSWTSSSPDHNYEVVVRDTSGLEIYRTTRTTTSVTLTVGLLGNFLSRNAVVTVRSFPAGAPTWLSSGSIASNIRIKTLGLGVECR